MLIPFVRVNSDVAQPVHLGGFAVQRVWHEAAYEMRRAWTQPTRLELADLYRVIGSDADRRQPRSLSTKSHKHHIDRSARLSALREALGDSLVVSELSGMARARVLVGVCIAMVGAYLAFDPGGRIELILAFSDYWWVAMGGLAIGMILQLIPNVASRVLICLFGTATLIGIFGLPSISATVVADFVPAVLSIIGAALATTSVKKRVDLHFAMLWYRRARAPRAELPALTRLVCLVGGLRLDLTSASVTEGQRLRIKMIAADVAIVIPGEWRCRVTDANLVGTWVREHGQIPETGPVLNLELTAFGSVLTVLRN